jgi:hypothetical protein
MYSPKIRKDLIPILYKKSKIADIPMTDYVDELLRSQILEVKEEDERYFCCSCRMQVEIVGDGKGYCDHCECVVFVEKI